MTRRQKDLSLFVDLTSKNSNEPFSHFFQRSINAIFAGQPKSTMLGSVESAALIFGSAWSLKTQT